MKNLTFRTLPLRAKHHTLALAALIRERGSSGTSVHYDDAGGAHLKGGYARRGEYVPAHTRTLPARRLKDGTMREERTVRVASYTVGSASNADREAYGYTAQDLTDLKRVLGMKAASDVMEGILTEALSAYDDGQRPGRVGQTAAQRMARARDRAVENGRCLVCRRNPARPNRRTCEMCNDSAKARVKRRRQALKGSV